MAEAHEPAAPTGESPAASVVLPTHGRRESLLRVLRALAQQTVADCFEVIVVCDGDIDGSAAACRGLAPPYTLRVIEQQNQGPAVARNRGVCESSSPLIIFIDDDVVPDPGLIAAHLASHAGHADRVAIGPLLPPPDARLAPWAAWEERTLCRQYDAMIAGEWAPTYRQFYTGNASVLKRHLIDAGGFDPSFQRAEDVELALRLRDRGLQFRFVPEARGWHYIQRSFESWLALSAAYGAADMAMARAGRREVLEIIQREYGERNAAVRALASLCVGRPALMQVATWLLALQLRIAAAMRADAVAFLACSLLFNLRHYDTLAASLGGRAAFLALLAGQPVASLLGSMDEARQIELSPL